MYGVRDADVLGSVRRTLSWPDPGSVWTKAAVIARLERVARFMIYERPERPSDRMAMRIETVRDYWLEYGREQARLQRVLPSGREIDQVDEALRWLFWIEGLADRDLVWARACGQSWRRLAPRMGLSERGVRARHSRLILGLVLRLNT